MGRAQMRSFYNANLIHINIRKEKVNGNQRYIARHFASDLPYKKAEGAWPSAIPIIWLLWLHLAYRHSDDKGTGIVRLITACLQRKRRCDARYIYINLHRGFFYALL